MQFIHLYSLCFRLNVLYPVHIFLFSSSHLPLHPFALFFLTFLFWPFQNSGEIRCCLICMHLHNIACAVFAVKGIEERVLVGVYVLSHWHQTVLWYGNGRAKIEWLHTEALFGCRPRSVPPFLYLCLSLPFSLTHDSIFGISHPHLYNFLLVLPQFHYLLSLHLSVFFRFPSFCFHSC